MGKAMTVQSSVVLGLGISTVLSLILTELCRVNALKYGIVDAPSTEVKTHKVPTPYLGGLAIVLSICVTYVAVGAISASASPLGFRILLGGLAALVLGLWDDLRPLSPLGKLCGQAAIALGTIIGGVMIQWTGLLVVDGLITALWILTLMNAVNLIDIMDGLAGGITAIGAVALALLLGMRGEWSLVLLMVSVVGATVGFLRYNFHPARIFMGDAGSMALGYILAATITAGFWSGRSHGLEALVVLLAVAIPLFELVFLSIVRVSQGKSPLQGSKDHFALRLRKRGLTVRQTVVVSYVSGIGLAVGALWGFQGVRSTLWVLGIAIVLLVLTGIALARIQMGEQKESYPPTTA